jgi:hypothetical protein
MITDNEVLRLFEEADPARAPDTAPVTDAVSYLHTLWSSTNLPAVATVPASIPAPRRRARTAVAAVAAVSVLVLGALISRDDEPAPPQIGTTPPTTTFDVRREVDDLHAQAIATAYSTLSAQVRSICAAAKERHEADVAAAAIDPADPQALSAWSESMARDLEETLPELRALVAPTVIRDLWELTYSRLAQLPTAWRNPNATGAASAAGIIHAVEYEFGLMDCTLGSPR